MDQTAEIADVNAAIDRITWPTRKASSLAGKRSRAASRILVALDGTETSLEAASWAAGLARLHGARVWVISVLAPESVFHLYAKRSGWKGARAQLLKKDQENGSRIVANGVAFLKKAGVAATGLMPRGYPVPEIEAASQAHRIDLIILGSHGHSNRERLFLGSVADGVTGTTKADVLLAKGPFRPGPLLAPIDGSEPSRAAAVRALHLAKSWKTPTTLLHVFEIPWLGYAAWGEDEFHDIITKFDLPTKPENVRYVLDFGRPAERILAHAADLHPSLIVMGSRGVAGLKGAALGSASNRVAHECKASILLIKSRR